MDRRPAQNFERSFFPSGNECKWRINRRGGGEALLADSGAIISGPTTFFRWSWIFAENPFGFVACPADDLVPPLPFPRNWQGCLPAPFPAAEFKRYGSGRSSRRAPKPWTWPLGASAHDTTREKLNRHRAYREPCTPTHPASSPLPPDSLFRIQPVLHLNNFLPYNPYLLTLLNALHPLENSSKFKYIPLIDTTRDVQSSQLA